MISFKFDLDKQEEYYKSIKGKLHTQFYQEFKFYVLPFMPEKFRGRVVFLPETCEPLKIYRKQKTQIDKLEKSWQKVKDEFVKTLKTSFSKINSVDILISPQLYGTIGSYEIEKNKIIVMPRYDRKVVALQKLIITALITHEGHKLSWTEKQNKAFEVQSILFPDKKSMIKILDTEFAGRLAEKSVKYLEKLKFASKSEIRKPSNLTKNETEVFNLLLRNKNRLVTFEEISEWLWKDKLDEKYSEYAITKLIERVKKKLPKNSIHSQRGTGYLLYI